MSHEERFLKLLPSWLPHEKEWTSLQPLAIRRHMNRLIEALELAIDGLADAQVDVERLRLDAERFAVILAKLADELKPVDLGQCEACDATQGCMCEWHMKHGPEEREP